MRSLFGCSKRSSTERGAVFHAAFPLLIAVLMVSCGGNEPAGCRRGRVITGDIIIRGGGPLNRTVFVEDRYGIRTLIAESALGDELAALEDHPVRIEGEISGSPKYGYSIEVSSYELIPPGGMKAVRGVIEHAAGRTSIITPAEEYIIEGKLEQTLLQMVGYELWIWGTEKEKQEGYTVIEPEGYELIGPGG